MKTVALFLAIMDWILWFLNSSEDLYQSLLGYLFDVLDALYTLALLPHFANMPSTVSAHDTTSQCRKYPDRQSCGMTPAQKVLQVQRSLVRSANWCCLQTLRQLNHGQITCLPNPLLPVSPPYPKLWLDEHHEPPWASVFYTPIHRLGNVPFQ